MIGVPRHNIDTIYCRKSTRIRFSVDGVNEIFTRSRTCNWTWFEPKICNGVSSCLSFNVLCTNGELFGVVGSWADSVVDDAPGVEKIRRLFNTVDRRLISVSGLWLWTWAVRWNWNSGRDWLFSVDCGLWMWTWGVRWMWNWCPRCWRSAVSRTWWLLHGKYLNGNEKNRNC